MAIVREQSKTGQSSGGTSGYSLAFDTNITANSVLVCMVSAFLNGASGAPFTITDNNGNTWTETYDLTFGGSGFTSACFAYVEGANSGATTVTINSNASVDEYFGVVLVEVSGLVTTGALDVNNSNTATSTNWTSGNVTTTNADSYMIGFLSHDNGNQSLTEDAAFSLVAEYENGDTGMPYSCGERILSSTVTDAFTGTIGGSTEYWAGVLAFNGAAGSSPVTISGALGTLSIAGVSASVTPGTASIGANLGAVTLAGLQASVSTTTPATTISGNSGTLAMAGLAADVQPGAVSISAAAANATIAGLSASIQAGAVTLSANTELLAISGLSASINVGAVTVSAALGTIALSGQSAGVSAGATNISAAAGAVTLAGLQANITTGAVTVSAGLGTLTLAGQSATVGSIAVISANIGNLTITSRNATITTGEATINGALGLLSLNGLNANISNNINSIATVSLSGNSRNLNNLAEDREFSKSSRSRNFSVFSRSRNFSI